MTSRGQPGSEPLELHVDACQPRKQFYGATCRRAFPWKMEGEEGPGQSSSQTGWPIPPRLGHLGHVRRNVLCMYECVM